MPTEEMRKVAEALLAAMRAENEGQHFYMMAARAMTDEKGKRVFEQLAAEEQDHFEFLKRQHKALLETGKPDANVKLGPRSDLTSASPIFSPAIRKRITDAHYEMTALSVGIQLELAAIQHYSRHAEESPEPRLKAFFLELADWERGHYKALLTQQDELKEDYWQGGAFAPF